MKSISNLLFLTFAATLAVAGCSSEEPIQTSSEEEAVTQICTPLDETCDFACFFQGGPTTNDCIIKCNATGTAWKTLVDCGYAQNLPFSSSCLDTEPHPICENN